MSNIKELIRQEILRRQEYHWEYLPDADSPEDDWTHNELCELGAFKELEHLEDFVDSLPEEKPSEDLEEAAEEYRRKSCNAALKPNIDGPMPEYGGSVKEAFIAGAEWMRKKDVEDMYMSDNRHFIKCYEQGKVDMKVEMMKDAVDGEIGYWNQRGLSIRLDKSLERLGYDMDTKVKIVIVKE